MAVGSNEAGIGLGSAAGVSACAWRLLESIADMPVVGTPADAPARAEGSQAATFRFMTCRRIATSRELAPAERAKIEAELVAARDRQASAAGRPKTRREVTL